MMVNSELIKSLIEQSSHLDRELTNPLIMEMLEYIKTFYETNKESIDNYNPNSIRFCDYYSNYYSIQYIIPKCLNVSILELVKNKNFLLDNYTNKIKRKTFITLSVPKFKIENEINFIPILENLGLGKIFNENFSTLKNPFIIKEGYNYYLNAVIQKNSIELNEDGTIIKSISYASIIEEAEVNIDLGFEIKLNQPFIYIIRDRNKLPIFIGYIKEPYYD